MAALANWRFWFCLGFMLLGIAVVNFALALVIDVNVPIVSVLVIAAIGFWCGWEARND